MKNRTLIEDELPLAAINAASAREKSYTPRGHISTLHLWWARRPVSMSRAVVFGSLVPSPEDAAARSQLLALLGACASYERSAAAEADLSKEIHRYWPDRPPRVLDCFAGGGTLPLEALRLGCQVDAVDLNPVAHLVELGGLAFPMQFNETAPDGTQTLEVDVRNWAGWVREKAHSELSQFFPASTTGRPGVLLWCRTMVCPDTACRRELPLLRSRKLADSKRRRWRIDFEITPSSVDVRVKDGPPKDGTDWGIGTMKASSVTCPACGGSTPAKDVRRYAKDVGFGERLFAVMELRESSRAYREPLPQDIVAFEKAKKALALLPETAEGVSAIPDEAMVKSQGRCLRNLIYGYDTWRSLFNDRQLLVIGTLAKWVRLAHEAMVQDGMAPERARAVATYIAFVVDKIADYNSSFCSWNSKNEQIRNTFPQQSIRMAWDYTEVDPFANASGSWDAMVDWTVRALASCCQIQSRPANVTRGNAQALDFDDSSFDAVIVDPPYYDAFQYGDLSDFFYVWLKRSIGHLYPELFLTPLTPKQAEVIENRAEKKSAEYISHDEFEVRLQRALNEIARVLKPDGILSLVFAHTDVEAWERLLRGLRAAGLVVTTSWPMRSERESRPTAQVSAVLGSSVVLVCRKESSAGDGYYDDVVQELESRIDERLAIFEEMQLVGADYFVSAIGPAFEVFARYKRVMRLSGEEVGVDELMVLARQAVARHAARRLLGGESLAALDDGALLYLTWRWAYDGEAIPADEAYKLGRAFDIDFADLTKPEGLVKKTGDTFHLLGPQDRRNVKVATGSSLVDVLQVACQLHDAGRRKELVELLGATGAGTEPGFWALASAIAQALPDGDREKTMLLGLTANRETLAVAAQHSRPTEVQSLFDNRTPSMFGDDPPTLFEGSTP